MKARCKFLKTMCICLELTVTTAFYAKHLFHTSNPKYKIFDGVVQSNSEVLELSAKNIQSVVNKNRSLVFIMLSSNASGSYTNVQEFEIDSDTGAFYHTTKEYDWMRYGHPDDYPLNR